MERETTVKRVGRKAGQGSKWIRPVKRQRIYARDSHCCTYCGSHVTDGAILTLDHVVACELGGTNHETNLVTCCLSCNSRKRALTVRQFLALLRKQGTDTSGIARRVRAAVKRQLPRLLKAVA